MSDQSAAASSYDSSAAASQESPSSKPTQLPDGLQFYARQCGGHHHEQGRGRLGVLYDPATNHILKHLPTAHAQREVEFYEELVKDEKEQRQPWPRFIPRYYGKRTILINGKEEAFIELDDATNGLHQPMLMDCKVGGIEKRDDTPEREERRRAHYPLYAELGFRLDGCQIYDAISGQYKRLSPKATNKTVEDIDRAIRSFLRRDQPNAAPAAIARGVTCKLTELERWLSGQTKWRYYSSSVLVMYESESSDAVSCRAAFVDFVHACKSDSVDQFCLKGLRRLKEFLWRNADIREPIEQ